MALLLGTLAPILAAPITYSHDSLNRLTRVAYPDGTTIAYTYDSVGNRLSQVIANAVGSNPPPPPVNATANVLLIFTPNPVPLSVDKQWHYVLQLQEVNGVGVTLTNMTTGAIDQTKSIASWFGSTKINPAGQLAGSFVNTCTATCTSTVDYIWQFSGTDDNGHSGLIWRGTVLFAPAPPSVPQTSPGYVIKTVVGTGIAGFSGDGGPGTKALIDEPSDVAVDSVGNLFIADFKNNRICKLATDGTITTVVGTGIRGFSGDGGPATQAQLNSPLGLAVDATGNLFIADAGNGRIRKVTPDGSIVSVVGSGAYGYSGDGGPATSAAMTTPTGVAVDAAGDLFIADFGNNRIRKVTGDGVIVTVAGNGQPGYSGDGGSATNAQLFGPDSVAVTASGDLYISEENNSRIRHVTPAGTITTAVGNGTVGNWDDDVLATEALIPGPQSVKLDAAGNIFLTDGSNRVRRIAASTGTITTVAGTGVKGYSGDGGPATSAQLAQPTGLTVDAAGQIYVADTANNVIRVLVPQPALPRPND